jgi:hypothetical protein
MVYIIIKFTNNGEYHLIDIEKKDSFKPAYFILIADGDLNVTSNDFLELQNNAALLKL